MSTEGNIPAGFKLHHTLRGHKKWIGRIAWSPDGQILASSSYDKTVRLWDTVTGRQLQTLTEHSYSYSVAWSPDGHLLASCDGRAVRLWNTLTWQAVQFLTHSDYVLSVAWSPDGRVLASCSEDHTIGLWNPSTGR